MLLKWEWLYYQKIQNIKDKIFLPFILLLDKLHIKPNHLTFVGFVFFILFFVYLPKNIVIATVFLILGFVQDIFDGILARYQKVASDKGKFLDIVFDNINFTIFVAALSRIDLIDGSLAVYFVYLMLLDKVFRILHKAPFLTTDWLFKPFVGLVPNLIAHLSFFVFFSYLLFNFSFFYINLVFAFFTVILFFDALYFCFLVLNKKYERKP